MKRDNLFNTLPIFILVLAASILSGCDGLIGVRGRVYECLQPAQCSESIVYIDTINSVPPAQLAPVQGAEVIVEPWSAKDRDSISEPELFILKATTDKTGYFERLKTTAPWEHDATFIINLPGYLPVEHVFKHDQTWHNIIVVLAPEKNP